MWDWEQNIWVGVWAQKYYKWNEWKQQMHAFDWFKISYTNSQSAVSSETSQVISYHIIVSSIAYACICVHRLLYSTLSCHVMSYLYLNTRIDHTSRYNTILLFFFMVLLTFFCMLLCHVYVSMLIDWYHIISHHIVGWDGMGCVLLHS